MQTSEDTAMLSALKDNSIDAYQYFFMKYYKPLCVKACQLLGNMERAKDTVQQIFIEVWKKGTYRDIRHSPGGYFYQLVCEQCRQMVTDAALEAERLKTQCPPCRTGPALIPQALHPQLLV
jgi:DNA-directed RNA polymerase specialized sigma24 family protein